MSRISLVIPCYNEEDVLRQTYDRLCAVLPALEHEVEVIFVDDGSRDATPALMREICERDSRFNAIFFSRNFGHQAALCAGMDASNGDAIVMMDADLQDPPELIGELIAKWQQGYEVVYTRRIAREAESFFKRATAYVFYRLFNALSQLDLPKDAADFRLIDRRVADIVRHMPEKARFLRGMIAWVGFRQAEVTYHRQSRAAGHTHYYLRNMLRLAGDGIVSFSHAPLRIATWCGLLSILGVVSGGIAAYLGWSDIPVALRSSALITLAIAFFSGVQLVCLGIIGEYLGRVHVQSKDRPLYIISHRIGGRQ